MEIPLFPLPNLVVYPNVILPLHIFEERYKEMINACIGSGEVFGLLLLREGAQEETEQTIHRSGTTARVIQVERLDGGRMNVLCQGESRFQVLRFTQSSPYWKGNVEFFEDQDSNEETLMTLWENVATLYGKAYELGLQINPGGSSELRLPQSPVDLSFMITYVLDMDAEVKQKLLEMRSTEQRLRDLVEHVEEAIQKLEKQLAYKEIVHKVRGNGDLGKPGQSS